LQRKKAILRTRLKVPPCLNHFNQTLDQNNTKALLRLLTK